MCGIKTTLTPKNLKKKTRSARRTPRSFRQKEDYRTALYVDGNSSLCRVELLMRSVVAFESAKREVDGGMGERRR